MSFVTLLLCCGASGRYSTDVPVESRNPAMRKLRCITSSEFDTFVAHTVKPNQLAFIACVREDDPQCRQVMQVLEFVNGALSEKYPQSVQYSPPSEDDGSTAPAPASTGPDCPYWLVKFDMAESRCALKP